MLLEYDSLPDEAFLKVIRMKDIRRARILTPKEVSEKGLGNRDVMLESPLGYAEYITRSDLVKYFKYPNGKRIQLIRWMKGKKYIVVADDNRLMYAMYIPAEYQVKIDRAEREVIVNKDGKSHYIVCLSDANDSIDRRYAFVLPSDIFRKMFRYANLQDVEAFINGGISSRAVKNNADKEIDFGTPAVETKAEPKVEPKVETKVERVRTEQANPADQKVVKYTAIGKITENGKVTGFVLQSLETSEVVYLDKLRTMELCRAKLVNNLGIRELNGKFYIHGVGIRIEELPDYSFQLQRNF